MADKSEKAEKASNTGQKYFCSSGEAQRYDSAPIIQTQKNGVCVNIVYHVIDCPRPGAWGAAGPTGYLVN